MSNKKAKVQAGSRANQKRAMILDAARQVFAEEGLEGASLRSIAERAGYTPAALYFHFASREALYAEVLEDSLKALGAAVAKAGAGAQSDDMALRAAALAFFQFYAAHPRDLDLGFYLFRGGMKPAGLGRERDGVLNAALAGALEPIRQAAVVLGASDEQARMLTVGCFAQATGLLLLLHTGRIRMFNASAPALMETYIDDQILKLASKEQNA